MGDVSGLVGLAKGGKVVEFFVAVDQGATNSRVAITLGVIAEGTEEKKFTELFEVYKFQANTAQVFINGLSLVGEQVSAAFGGLVSSGACIAAAGRILENGRLVDITNYDGGVEGRHIRVEHLPRTLFPLETTRFINDLESTCYGIYSLHVDGKLSSFFRTLWSSSDSNITLEPHSYAVLAMGTGLGGALLVYSRGLKTHEVLPCEFGHTIMPPLGSGHKDFAKETRMVEFISKKLYNSSSALEVEDICSGRGVGYAYNWLISELSDPSGVPAELPIDKIAANAVVEPTCPVAKEALLVHYKWLFRCAQSICIGNQTKGVFLAGDNQVSNEEFVLKNVGSFQEEFLNHPKSDWIKEVPIYAQTVSFNVNLLGSMYVAKTAKKA